MKNKQECKQGQPLCCRLHTGRETSPKSAQVVQHFNTHTHARTETTKEPTKLTRKTSLEHCLGTLLLFIVHN